MSLNNGYNKKKFEQFEKKQEAEYRRADMSEEDINEMSKFDYNLFRQERIFVLRTQSLSIFMDLEKIILRKIFFTFLRLH